MQDFIVQFLVQLNIAQLLGIAALFWFFYRRLNEKIEKIDEKFDRKSDQTNEKFDRLEEKLNDRMDRLEEKLTDRMDRLEEKLTDRMDRLEERLNARMDGLENYMAKLEEKVEDVDRRLCRIEGSLATHGHCLFNQTHSEKRAE